MTEPILVADSITKRFPGVLALERVSFDLVPGEVHALCGENGAGKSTLIKVLSGIHPHKSYEGELRIDGRPAAFRSTKDAEDAGLAVIYQELALVEEMTVAENIALGREPVRYGLVDWLTLLDRARKLLDRFGMAIDPEARVRDLGVGQQQLVEIVKALGKSSRLLILDEPTAALSDQEVRILLEILRELRDSGVTCVYISHRLEEVFELSDRITVLRDGKSIRTSRTSETSKAEVIRHMVGREITDLFPRRAADVGKALLEVDGLRVVRSDDRRVVIEDVSFAVHAGEVLGIGGLMGAGRTELLMHLFGAFGLRTAGRATLASEPLEGSPHDVIRRGLVLISEDRKRYGLILERSIGFNLSLSYLRSLTSHGLIDQDRELTVSRGMFSALRIKAPSLETVVGTLSGGNQQKVVLGKGLMIEPRVIFLDEPTRGIDVGAKLEVYELVNRLTSEGRAVVLVSSELPELLGMSDRIVMLHEGRVGGTFTRAEATPEKLLAAALGHGGDTPHPGHGGDTPHPGHRGDTPHPGHAERTG